MEKHTLAKDHITEGVIWKEMLLFFVPIMLGTLLQQLYNAADAIIVGQALGKEALAAVGGSSTSIITLLVKLLCGPGIRGLSGDLSGLRRRPGAPGPGGGFTAPWCWRWPAARC